MKKELCTNCGKNEPREGKKWCQECRTKHDNWRKNREENLLSQGLCVKCRTNKVEPGKKRCEECLQLERDIYKYKNKQYHKNSICLKCGQPKEENNGFRYCLNCRKKARKSQSELVIRRKNNHKCTNCGVELDNDTTKCWKCRLKHREYMKNYNKTKGDK